VKAIIALLPDPRHKMLVLVCASTAVRASEACGLKWGDINWEEMATWMVSIDKTDVKTAQSNMRHANPEIMLSKYAQAVTDEMHDV
jgi:integrase